MHSRTAWMLVITLLVVAMVISALFQPTDVGGVLVGFTPRQQDGSQEAVDFVRDLAQGRHEAAWQRTTSDFQADRDLEAFAGHAQVTFTRHSRVLMEAGPAPRTFFCTVEYEDRPPTHFAVHVSNDEGGWQISQWTFGTR